jgi:hypothetical protein
MRFRIQKGFGKWHGRRSLKIFLSASRYTTFPNATGTRAVCRWEADTVDSVRDLIDSTVGHYSKNEYFEINADNAMGLPT